MLMKKRKMKPSLLAAGYVLFGCLFMTVCIIISPIGADTVLPSEEKLPAAAEGDNVKAEEARSTVILMIDPGHGELCQYYIYSESDFNI